MAAELLTIEDVSKRLKVKPKTLAAWRRKGTGPRWIHGWRAVRLAIFYQGGDLLEWESSCAERGRRRQ
jgi:hypothetical protein